MKNIKFSILVSSFVFFSLLIYSSFKPLQALNIGLADFEIGSNLTDNVTLTPTPLPDLGFSMGNTYSSLFIFSPLANPNTPTNVSASYLGSGSRVNSTNLRGNAVTMTLSDPDVGNTVRYRIKYATSSSSNCSNTGNPVVDYTSALGPQGTFSFTFGQSVGGGTYDAGTSATNLINGNSYYVCIRTEDSSNNNSNSYYITPFTFYYDTTIPSTPSAPTLEGTATPSSTIINWTASAETYPANPEYKIEVSSNSGFSPLTTYTTNNNTYTFTSLSVGTHYIRIYVTDSAGNISDHSSSLIINIVNAPNIPTNVTASYFGITSRINTTTLEGEQISMDLSGPDVSNTIRYQIQFSTNVGFSSIVVDYLSALASQGTFNFTFGQSGGTYLIGSSSTNLVNGTAYYVRVRAQDNLGVTSAFTGPSGIAFTYDTSAPSTPSTPTLQGIATTSSTTIAWTASSEAHPADPEYTVEISNHSNFTSATTDMTNDNSYVFTGLTVGTYYVRIYVTDSADNRSYHSNTLTFSVDNPPNVPANITANYFGSSSRVNTSNLKSEHIHMDLSDPDVSNTVRYKIQFASDASFSSIVVDYRSALASQGIFTFTFGQSTGTGSYITGSSSTNLTNGHAYYVRMLAEDNLGAVSAYAGPSGIAFTYDTSAPSTPSTPTLQGIATTISTTIAWTASTEAHPANPEYTIEIATDDHFDHSVHTYTTNNTSYEFTGLSAVTHYVRIYVTDSASNRSDHSNTLQFSVDTPPSTPTSVTASYFGTDSRVKESTLKGQQISMNLSDPDGSDHVKYQFQFATDSSFNDLIIDYRSGLDHQGSFYFTFGQSAGSGSYSTGNSTTNLINGTSYYVRVRAEDEHGAVSAFTGPSGIAFTYDTVIPDALAIPVLVGKATTTATTISWNTAVIDYPAAQLYTLEIADNPDFSGSSVTSTNDTQHTYNGLIIDTYYVRVFVHSLAGNVSAASPVLSFLVNTPPNIPAGLTADYWGLLVPVNEDTVTTHSVTMTLTDNNVSDQVSYRIQFSTDIAFTGVVLDYQSTLQSQGSASFVLGQTGGTYLVGSSSMHLTDNSYYVRVKTIDDSNDVSSFTGPTGIAFTYDGTAPAALSIPFIIGTASTSSTTIGWTGTTETHTGNPIYKVEFADNSSFTGSTFTTTNLANHVYTGLEYKTYYVRVYVNDSAGNISLPSPALGFTLVRHIVTATATPTPTEVPISGEVIALLTVYVYDSEGNPIPNALVTLYSAPRTAWTNSLGMALFDNVEVGEHRIVVTYQGQTKEQVLAITTEKQSVQAEIQLTNVVITPTPTSGITDNVVADFWTGRNNSYILLCGAIIIAGIIIFAIKRKKDQEEN